MVQKIALTGYKVYTTNIAQELEDLKELYKKRQYELILEKCQELLLIEKHPKLFYMIGYIKDDMQEL